MNSSFMFQSPRNGFRPMFHIEEAVERVGIQSLILP